jgi:hypothetical protein
MTRTAWIELILADTTQKQAWIETEKTQTGTGKHCFAMEQACIYNCPSIGKRGLLINITEMAGLPRSLALNIKIN